MKIQLVIPMSGIGKRFKDAGYTTPKPLIKIRGKEIINHVVNMFGEIERVIFICNEEHLHDKKLNLSKILSNLHPKTTVVSIKPHKKGPIHAVLEAESILESLKPTIVNYCDFNSFFNFPNFINHLKKDQPDGCVFTYTGFHPHMLKNTNYAYVKKYKNSVVDIQEKKPFTENPMNEEVSSGTYYFKSAKLMLKYFKKAILLDLKVNGEFYVSMAYKPMIKDGLKIKTFLINYFMQWGTPSDLEDFKWYSNVFKNIIKKKNNHKNIYEGCLLMPMAGEGSRFREKGYKIPKPFIKISGSEMYIKAIKDLPRMENIKIVTTEKLIKNKKPFFNIKDKKLNISIKSLKTKPEGQACTSLKAFEDNSINLEKPLIISACDMGIIFDEKKYQKLIALQDIDILVWGCKGYPGAQQKPNMYSWIYKNKNENYISNISVKKNLFNPREDYVLIGTFTFKKAKYFVQSAELSIACGEKVNGEYYVDNVINKSIEIGLKVAIFEVDYFICWGTPNELETYNYWESCFKKWTDHPYMKR
ncbi:Hypothetical protein P9515_14021 [Prochlorococcus marinus str. MIT 9515]|uniref:Uncharacterized protein n=1 Tax=Prochlorococcus marinus (strain MIT 9515) TaxID=167542 RepID=A2BXU8_PROM5|nr:NTP transferase domain-containing protein [Prochlorococcus marinus]ABM72609.1 Hypothetical protein P9515_14021 [Prochlorococcus marinus str. MIT 9515]